MGAGIDLGNGFLMALSFNNASRKVRDRTAGHQLLMKSVPTELAVSSLRPAKLMSTILWLASASSNVKLAVRLADDVARLGT